MGDQRPLVDGEHGLHRDGLKPRLADMMPVRLLLEAGMIWARNNQPVDEYDDGKYPDLQGGVPNFKGGIRLTKYLDSMLRHLFALIQGEDQDPESGFDHAGHLLCNLAMFWWTRANLPAMDDRETKPANGLDPFAQSVKELHAHADMLERTQPGPEDPVA